jgi:hypothetical protein
MLTSLLHGMQTALDIITSFSLNFGFTTLNAEVWSFTIVLSACG